jgi:hypothetical protein
MRISNILTTAAAAALALGCGGSFPPPTQDLSAAQAAERSAIELGAAGQPQARLHLALAQEQMAKARAAMKDGNNERADGLLLRAKSDAELAIALTRDQTAKTEAQKAAVQSNAQTTTNLNQGAAQ